MWFLLFFYSEKIFLIGIVRPNFDLLTFFNRTKCCMYLTIIFVLQIFNFFKVV